MVYKTISIVVNARTQSTRVPNKLLRNFAGSCLIDILLEKIDQVSFIEEKYLATSETILSDKIKNYKTIKLLRRTEAATKKGVNPLEVTFGHFKNVKTDYILSVNPCLPFLTINTLREVYEYFQRTDFNSYTAAIPTGAWIFDPSGEPLTTLDPKNVTTNKNVSFYKGAHAFHIISRKFFEETNKLWTFTKNDPHLIGMPESEAIDIDTMEEFEFASMQYRNKILKQ